MNVKLEKNFKNLHKEILNNKKKRNFFQYFKYFF